MSHARDFFSDLTDHLPSSTWRPEAPPCLDRYTDIELDCESTGLQWWDGDRPIGVGLCFPDGRTQYLPWAHTGGGNLDEAVVKRWAQRELRGKRITNHNTRFDVHMLREWGVDLEAQGNTVSDVSHYAALLDDHRYRFSQEELCKDYLAADERKVKTVDGHVLDPSRMAEYHAGIVAVRAEADVRQVQKLKQVMWPLLTEQDLQRVRALEDDVIYVVCEMEKNGALIDLDLLDRWVTESETLYHTLLWDIYRETGVKFSPSPTGWKALFTARGVVSEEKTATQRPSYSDNVLKAIDDPVIHMARRATKLASLRSKYLLKDQSTIDRKTGILRYALHQLRATKDDNDGESSTGTVSGRFSSTEITKGVGQNIQQRIKVAKQRVSFGYDEDDESHDDEIFIIRKLHIPAKGHLFLSADAKQIEYRLFAHYANSPKVIAAYQENPDLKFHNFIQDLLRPYKSNVTYRQAKDLSFARIYGAGPAKLALMLEFITPNEFMELKRLSWREQQSHPLLAATREIERIYGQELPEVGPLLKRAAHLAETRGYVKTVLGRRARFPDKQRLHAALNRCVQGGAADCMKLKLVELHRERHHTGFTLRFTVHDEVVGDASNEESAKRVADLLDSQSFPFRIPILWDTKVGPSWAQVSSAREYDFAGAEATRSRQNILSTHTMTHGVKGE